MSNGSIYKDMSPKDILEKHIIREFIDIVTRFKTQTINMIKKEITNEQFDEEIINNFIADNSKKINENIGKLLMGESVAEYSRLKTIISYYYNNSNFVHAVSLLPNLNSIMPNVPISSNSSDITVDIPKDLGPINKLWLTYLEIYNNIFLLGNNYKENSDGRYILVPTSTSKNTDPNRIDRLKDSGLVGLIDYLISLLKEFRIGGGYSNIYEDMLKKMEFLKN